MGEKDSSMQLLGLKDNSKDDWGCQIDWIENETCPR